MMTDQDRTIVVIDDDPAVADQVRTACPTATVIATLTAVDGVDYVRTAHNGISLVVVDVVLPPYHGVFVARLLREIDRGLRILPYSQDTTKASLFADMGCAPLLPKPACTATLRTALAAALVMFPQPLPPSPWMLQYYLDADHVDRGVRHAQQPQVAVLASSTAMRRLLGDAATAGGCRVAACATSASALRPFLTGVPPIALLTDSVMQGEAQALADTCHLPLMVISYAFADGIAALALTPQAVLLGETNDYMVEAIAAVQAGRTFVDPRLSQRIAVLGFNDHQQAMLPYLVHEWPPDAIADRLRLARRTILTYKSRLFQALAITTAAELRSYLNGLR